jgi:GTP cyclohydrolase II
LANKIRAYALQALGADTIEANELLHLPVDARTYDVAAAILKEIGVGSIELLTNNPEKIDSLNRLGIEVERRVPVLVAANPFSAGYLEVKRRRMQHDLPIVASSPTVSERQSSDSEAPEPRSGRAAGC